MAKTASNSPIAEIEDARVFREACVVDGQCVQANSKQMIDVDNAATSEIMGGVPKLGGAETRQAMEAASHAFPAWSKKTAKEAGAGLAAGCRKPVPTKNSVLIEPVEFERRQL